MELRQLVYFEAVAKHLHFTRAAAALHVAQPSISQQIRQLEDELGAVLFHRMKRHVTLTDAGAALLPRVRSVMQALEEARDAVRDVAEAKGGRLTVGAPPSAGTNLLPDALAHFNTQHPGVALVFREGGSRALVRQLLDGELDLAVVIEPEGGWRLPALHTELLLKEALVLAVPPGHALESKLPVRLSALRDEPFVMLREGAYELRDQTLAACRRAGFEPRITLDGAEMDSALRFVAAGIGVALLPETVLRAATDARGSVRSAGAAGDLPTGVPLQGAKLSRTISLARRKDRYESAASRAFASLVRRAYTGTDVRDGSASRSA